MERQSVIEIVKSLGITAEELGVEPIVKMVTEKDTQLIHEVSQYIKESEDEEKARDYISEKYWDDLAIRPEKKYKIVTVKLQKTLYAEVKVAMPEDECDGNVEDYIDMYNIDSDDEDDWELDRTYTDTDDLTEKEIKSRYCEDDIYNYDNFAE